MSAFPAKMRRALARMKKELVVVDGYQKALDGHRGRVLAAIAALEAIERSHEPKSKSSNA